MENLKQAYEQVYAQVRPPKSFSTILCFIALTLDSHTNTVVSHSHVYLLVKMASKTVTSSIELEGRVNRSLVVGNPSVML